MKLKRSTSIHPNVFLVADHLDTALAAGEDLLKLAPWTGQTRSKDDTHSHLAASAELRSFIESARRLEMVIAARILQARQRAAELRRSDARFKAVIELFLAGTAVIEDAIAELGDSTRADFQTGEQPHAYLHSRHVSLPGEEDPEAGRRLAITEHFRIAQRIELGTLLDLVATFLDALDLHYDLYALPDASEAAA